MDPQSSSVNTKPTGSQHDVWSGLTLRNPRRHPGQHLTVTCVIYNTIVGGVPSEEDVVAAVEDMERLYESCGQTKVGRLADAEFNFMKKDLTVTSKDGVDSTADESVSESAPALPTKKDKCIIS